MILYKRRWIQAICGGLVLCLLLSVCGVYGQAAGVREQVVRLHILANSDSTEDQHLKMLVRDAVVAAADGWTDTAQTTEEALEQMATHLPTIQQTAEHTIREAGYAYPVAVELRRLYFTTRQYDTATLPAGMYDAVQITIGDGAGQNWWCVVYPPLCAGAATDLSRVFTPAEEGLVQNYPRYVLRFKVVEWVESFLQIFR